MDTHARSGVIATGRKDGHVLLWNVSTGFLRKDLMGGIFERMDEDKSGTLSADEVIDYLTTKEHWSKQEAMEFCNKADADGSGDVSKVEFVRELELRRTIEMIDPETGQAVYTRNDQNIEWVRFMTREENLIAAASSDGIVTFYDRILGNDVCTINLVLDDRHSAVTCVTFDSREDVLIVGDSKGKIRCYDIKSTKTGVRQTMEGACEQSSSVVSTFQVMLTRYQHLHIFYRGVFNMSVGSRPMESH